MNPYFFGYGSLVNTATHTYGDPHPATLKGWRRAWVCTEVRDVVFLTAVPAPESSIEGLIAAVPNADWEALDEREFGYARIGSGDAVRHPLGETTQVEHYAVPQSTWRAGEPSNFILLSYLDVVVQGYLQVFGEAGVDAFFETTDGWETPILNDRAAPRYPRHQKLTAEETELVDRHLARLPSVLKER